MWLRPRRPHARAVDRLGVDEASASTPRRPSSRRSALFPTLDVQLAVGERLPYPDDLFDHALPQLVVHFMTDPVGGLQEMARVTRPAAWSACVGTSPRARPISVLWRAARDLDPGVLDESDLPGAREGDLERLCHAAGLAAWRAESSASRCTTRASSSGGSPSPSGSVQQAPSRRPATMSTVVHSTIDASSYCEPPTSTCEPCLDGAIRA